jgi:hypothetical protein
LNYFALLTSKATREQHAIDEQDLKLLTTLDGYLKGEVETQPGSLATGGSGTANTTAQPGTKMKDTF